MPAKSSLPVGQDRGSATLGPKEGGVAGSRSPKAGSGPRPQCFSWCLSLPAAPAQPGDPRGPREGALRPLAGAGNDDTGRLWGRGRRLAQSPSYWDGLRSIPFPGEGNLLLPFLSSPSLPSTLPSLSWSPSCLVIGDQIAKQFKMFFCPHLQLRANQGVCLEYTCCLGISSSLS